VILSWSRNYAYICIVKLSFQIITFKPLYIVTVEQHLNHALLCSTSFVVQKQHNFYLVVARVAGRQTLISCFFRFLFMTDRFCQLSATLWNNLGERCLQWNRFRYDDIK